MRSVGPDPYLSRGRSSPIFLGRLLVYCRLPNFLLSPFPFLPPLHSFLSLCSPSTYAFGPVQWQGESKKSSSGRVRVSFSVSSDVSPWAGEEWTAGSIPRETRERGRDRGNGKESLRTCKVGIRWRVQGTRWTNKKSLWTSWAKALGCKLWHDEGGIVSNRGEGLTDARHCECGRFYSVFTEG